MKNIKNFIKRYNKLSLSSQIFVMFTSFVVLMILIQYIVYTIMFSDFYINSNKNDINDLVEETVEQLKSKSDLNYYDILKDYTTETNSLTVILDSNFNLVQSNNETLSITVIDTNTYQNYSILLPSDEDIEINDRVSAEVTLSTDSSFYNLYSLTVNNRNIYSTNIKNLTKVNGIVVDINKPSNLNETYSNNQLIVSELFKLRNSDINLSEENSDSYQYQTNDEYSQNLVYLNKINDSLDTYMLSIFVISTNNDLFNILSTYNIIVYLSIIIIAIVISYLVAASISKPIENLEEVANEISKQNFSIKAKERQNKEVTGLSDSINTISKNLSSNISELTERNIEITKLFEDQQKQSQVQKRFIQAISHELKTPLMVMNLSVQGIIDDLFNDEEKKDELERILNEIENVDLLIREMLDVFKFEQTKQTDMSESINLKTVTIEIVKSLETLTKQYSQNIEVHSTRSPIITGNKKQIILVISNIITNAVKYTPNNENIIINITEKKGNITFLCTNYGITIPEEKLVHLFEPFYRVDESRTKAVKTKGTGLGLYIVSETLKAHNFKYGIHNVKNGVVTYFIASK